MSADSVYASIFTVILGGYLTFFAWSFTGFLYCSALHPIKGRFPKEALFSTVGSFIIVTNICLAYAITGIDKWPCWVSYATPYVGYPMLVLPYLLRSWKLINVFRIYESRNVVSLIQQRKNHQVEGGGDSINKVDPTGSVGKPIPDTNVVKRVPNPAFSLSPSKNHLVRAPMKKISRTTRKGMSVSINWFGHKTWQTDIPTLVFLAIVLTSLIVAVTSYVIDPVKQGVGCMGREDPIPRAIFLFLFIACFVVVMVMLRHYHIRDEFNILHELQLVFVFVLVTAIPIIALLLIVAYDTQVNTNSELWKEYYFFIHLLYVGFATLPYVVTIAWPLTVVIRRGIKVLEQRSHHRKEKTKQGGEVLESLISVLTDPKCLMAFKEFTQLEFNSENILFYLDVELYKQCTKDTPERLYEQAEYIYDTYLNPDAEMKVVKISDTETKSIELALVSKKVSIDLFTGAQKEVFLFMERDTFPRFKESNSYATLKKKLDKGAEFYADMNKLNML